MDNNGHRVNLFQHRKLGSKWQHCPVTWENSKPNPRLVLVGGEPTSWKGGGAYYLDWKEGGKRVRKQAGKTPREALDSWYKAIGIANGSIEPEPELPQEEASRV